MQRLSLVLISIAGGTQKASEYAVCTNELGARRGVYTSLKLAEAKRRFPGFGNTWLFINMFYLLFPWNPLLGPVLEIPPPSFLPFFFVVSQDDAGFLSILLYCLFHSGKNPFVDMLGFFMFDCF